MKTMTPTELRRNIYQVLDEILNTGVPVEINTRGKKLIITPMERTDKLQKLVKRKNFIKGNPEDLIDITWEKEVHFDLP